MKALIDSDVLIDYLQGIAEAKREIDRYSQPLYSIVSWMEVLCGAENEAERDSAAALFRSMKKIDLSQAVAEKAAEERKSLGLKLPDAIILASADIEGCILVTRNTRDFSAEDPRVRYPYSL